MPDKHSLSDFFNEKIAAKKTAIKMAGSRFPISP